MKLPCLDCGKAHERSEDCANGENHFIDIEIRTDSIKIGETLAYLNDMNYSSDDLGTIKELLTENKPENLSERAKDWLKRRSR